MSLAHCRHLLETRQVTIYFVVVLLAAIFAWQFPGAAALTPAIDPLLGLMLFVTFLQVPLAALRQALSNVHFLGAILAANFIAIPLLVMLLLGGLPTNPLLRLGAALVLLAPCIDYVVTFAHSGRADARQLLASTPVLLAAQMLLLPIFLGLLVGHDADGLLDPAPFLHAFVWLIAVPLALAGMCQVWAERSHAGQSVVGWLGVLPVPATAVVLFVVVVATIPQLSQSIDTVWTVIPIYVLFAVIAPWLGWGAARLWRLPADQGRAVAFSSATRNSLVVLPIGMAIPGAVPVIPAVIVAQTLVELLSELVYVKLLSRLGEGRRGL